MALLGGLGLAGLRSILTGGSLIGGMRGMMMQQFSPITSMSGFTGEGGILSGGIFASSDPAKQSVSDLREAEKLVLRAGGRLSCPKCHEGLGAAAEELKKWQEKIPLYESIKKQKDKEKKEEGK